MARHLVLLAAAFLAIFASGSHADEAIPHGQLPDDVLPQRYALTLTIDPRQTSFTGEVEIQVQLKKPSKRIWLHGRGLQVKHATLQAHGQTQPLRYTEVDTLSGVSRLDLPQTAPAGSGTLRVSYAADFRTEPEGL